MVFQRCWQDRTTSHRHLLTLRTSYLVTALPNSRSVDVLRQNILNDLDQSSECLRVVDNQLSQALTTNLDVSQVQVLDEAIIGDVVSAGSSAGALNSQAMELTLTMTTVAELISLGMEHLLLGLAV